MAKKKGPKKIRCAFCERHQEQAVEDIIPRWLDRLLRPTLPKSVLSGSTGYMRHTQARASTGHEKTSRRVGGVTGWKLKGVCKSCNTGWMSKIEKLAAAAMHDAILGQAHSFSEDEQATIATWMVLKALCFDLHGPESFLQRSECRAFHDNPGPPASFQMWIGKYDDDPYFRRLIRVMTPIHNRDPLGPFPADSKHAQLLTLVAYKFVMQSVYVAAEVANEPLRYQRAEFPVFAKSIWPVTGPVDWPPFMSLTPELLSSFSSERPWNSGVFKTPDPPPPPFRRQKPPK
jgi:hypothetical protein